MSLQVLQLPKRVYSRVPKCLPIIEQYPLYSLNMNGTGYINIPDSASLNFGNGLVDRPTSFMVYVKMVDATYFGIVARYTAGANREYWFQTGGTDKLQLILYDSSVPAFIGRLYDTPLTGYQGRYIFLSATYDGSGLVSGIRIYLNGVRVDDTDYFLGAYVAMEHITIPTYIGRSNGDYARGIIALPTMYNRVLNLAEIHRNMRNPMNPIEDGLVLRLPVIEGQGINVADYSGQGNHGVLTGGVSWYEMALYEALADTQ